MKQKILDFMSRKDFYPLGAEDLMNALEIEEQDLEAFFAALREGESEGSILCNKKGRYGLCRHMNLLAGRIEGKGAGYAFFIPDIKNRGDIFIPAAGLHGALHNDRVLVRVVKEQKFVNGKDEGEVTKILHRANETVIGAFEVDEESHCGFVVPDDKRIAYDLYIPKSLSANAKDGDMVVAEVTHWPEGRKAFRGKIVEIIGRKDAPGTDMETVIRKFQLPAEFPKEVVAEAERQNRFPKQERKKRVDLRDSLIVTIDGADARDLDDAVSLEKLSNGHYLLGVHIADVGHYVPVGSLLDKEAYRRGTSVYFPDRVIPMLPSALSNGICSINQGEERLTLTCRMEIDAKGRVVDSDIFESVICSAARMAYDDVNALLRGEGGVTARYFDIKELFFELDELRAILTRKREKRGALTFDFPEAKVILDDLGEPREIRLRTHDRAESIIEECMIVANETVAETFFHRDIPFIYRVHDLPNDEKLLDLKDALAPFGYTLGHNITEIRSYHFQRLLKKLEGTDEEPLLQTMILRAMSHALYDTENRGHFGLASECYCHFTSPIRRYPDLAIHRVIKDMIHFDGQDEKRGERLLKRLGEAAMQSSIREKVAEDAERDAVEMKMAQYMAGRIDEEYSGVISGVTAYGFYVKLENTVEGLVHISTLEQDEYEFHPHRFMLCGKKNKVCFRLGMPVKIKVSRVHAEEHLIDFDFVAFEEGSD